MEIFDFSKNKNGTKGFMVRVNKREAYQLMQSIAAQLVNNNPNTGRHENFADLTDGEKHKEVYFSISVQDNEEEKKK
jgi:hypothetical protein